MNNALSRMVICLTAVAVAAACSAPTNTPARTATPSGNSSDAVSAGTDADAGDGVGAAPSAPPSNAALLTAQTYVRMWARPQLDQSTWYAGVKPLVTAAYGQLLADTDPAHVPAHGITGSPRPVSSNTAVLVADVPTDAGAIRVTVVNDEDRWRVATAGPAPAR
jgi:hypothetical protein